MTDNPSSKLVADLRTALSSVRGPFSLMDKAADEIERLRQTTRSDAATIVQMGEHIHQLERRLAQPPSDGLRAMLIRCRDSTIPGALRFDIDQLLGLPATKEPVLAAGCHRSHPHEDMSAECEQLTVEARDNNKRAHETTAPQPPKHRWINFGSLENGRCSYAHSINWAACRLPAGHDGPHLRDGDE